MGTSNWNLLAFSLALLLLIILCNRLVSRINSMRLRRVAAAARMRYSLIDRFHLAPRAGPYLALGAADVRVRDLMYRIDTAEYLYLFTAEYALGSVHGTRRCRIVVRARERAGRSNDSLVDVRLADARLTIREQYVALLDELSSAQTELALSPTADVPGKRQG